MGLQKNFYSPDDQLATNGPPSRNPASDVGIYGPGTDNSINSVGQYRNPDGTVDTPPPIPKPRGEVETPYEKVVAAVEDFEDYEGHEGGWDDLPSYEEYSWEPNRETLLKHLNKAHYFNSSDLDFVINGPAGIHQADLSHAQEHKFFKDTISHYHRADGIQKLVDKAVPTKKVEELQDLYPAPTIDPSVYSKKFENNWMLHTQMQNWDANTWWFDGTARSIRTRIAEGTQLMKQARAAKVTNIKDQLREEIAVLEKMATEYDNFEQAEKLLDVPGGTVAMASANLIEGGLVDLGPDDGSWLYAEAKKVQQKAATRNWQRFATAEAAWWTQSVIEDSPALLNYASSLRQAAIDYAQVQTAQILDVGRKAKLIDDFVNNAEKERRRLKDVSVQGRRESMNKEADVKNAAYSQAVDAISGTDLLWI